MYVIALCQISTLSLKVATGNKNAFPRFRKVSHEQLDGVDLPRLINDRNEFRKHLDVGKKDFSTIEYLLRRGRNQLEAYSEPGIKDIHR